MSNAEWKVDNYFILSNIVIPEWVRQAVREQMEKDIDKLKREVILSLTGMTEEEFQVTKVKELYGIKQPEIIGSKFFRTDGA